MRMDKKLYPFKFISTREDRPWGTEAWAVADLGFVDNMVDEGWLAGNTLSELVETYLERVVGETSFEFYGTQFPVMVKFLDVRGRTSLHVNTDDTIAQQRYDTFGKTALWYVVSASDDARIYLGWNRDLTGEELFAVCSGESVDSVLNEIKPKAGDSFLITPGTVHAAKGRLVIAEISECSNLWFRLHSPNPEDTELHLEEAFDLVDLKKYEAPEEHHHHDGEHITRHLAETPQFSVTEIRLTDPLHIYAEKFDSFLLYTCLRGGAVIEIKDGDAKGNYRLKEGEVIMVPAEVKDFFLIPAERDTLLLEAVMDHREETDPYLEEEEHHHHDGCDCEGHHHHYYDN